MNNKLTLKDLNAENCINLLQPLEFECGCGGYAEMILDNKNEMLRVATGLLKDTDCGNAWIYIITPFGVCGAYTSREDILNFESKKENEFKSFDEQVDFIKELIKESKPHCIGVLQHTSNNCYRVVMEDVYDEMDNRKLN